MRSRVLAAASLAAFVWGCTAPGPPRPEARAERPDPAVVPPGAAAPGAPSGAGRFHFVDVAGRAGLDRVTWCGRPTMDHLLDSAGTGAAFLDYDRDGVLDVYLVNAWRLSGSEVVERGRNALYRGRGDGTFEDVTDRARVGGEGRWGAGAAAADYDGDGWTDLLVTNFGANVLYRNRGDGAFEDVAAAAGVEVPGWNTGAAFLDADADGDLDLYVAGYVDCTMKEVLDARPSLSWKGLEMVAFGPFGLKGAPDHFFLSDGKGRFTDATVASGTEDRALGFGFAVRAADYDGDGDLDIYVANDSDANYLYRNDGHGRFEEVGVWSGCALDAHGAAQASMGIAAGDVTGDGILDLLVSNFSEDFSTLYKGLGAGFFEDISQTSGVGAATYKSLKWGTAFADFDNDGDLDAVIAAGHIYPQIDRHPEIVGTFAQRSILLENDGAGNFRDVAGEAGPGFASPRPGRSLVVGDYDGDGDVDILITNLNEPPSLLRNDGPQGSWLTVVPIVPPGAGSLIGTLVTVTAGGRTQSQDIAAGDSYVGTHDPRPHFGLGAATIVDVVDVRWPDGTHTLRRGVPAGKFVEIRKGE